MGRTYKTEGIILKRSDFGEADRVLTIFTKHDGKIRVIARGVRKTTSRKGPSLELFNHVRLFVVEGKNLGSIAEAEVINSFPNFRKDLKKVALAYQACELVDKLTAEQSENRQVFELLQDYLCRLSHFQHLSLDSQLKARAVGIASGDARQSPLLCFQLSLLEILGFWPRGKTTNGVNLEAYIETLIERKLKSEKFLSSI